MDAKTLCFRPLRETTVRTKQPYHGNKFHHACSDCYFLGSCEYNGDTYDLYLHYLPRGDMQMPDSVTLIADRSQYGGDYMSGTSFALTHLFRGEPDHPLAVALKKVWEMQWIDHEDLQIRLTDENLEYAEMFMQPHLKNSQDHIKNS